ncbi:MAG: tetratricopeptide repeat protein, partial [Candidatus Omnitrophica bacterium]|nr:tetratricopeptide repeat protein [Candidatus Omnitrophota bacterium]
MTKHQSPNRLGKNGSSSLFLTVLALANGKRELLPFFIAAALLAPPAQTARALEPTAGYPEIQRAFLREEFEQVTALAQTFILQHPDVPELTRVWLWLSLSLDRLGEPNEALRELDRLKKRLPEQDPVWPELLFWEGDISRRAQRMDRARSAYQRLLARFPDASWTSQARLGLGLMELHQDAFEAAIE